MLLVSFKKKPNSKYTSLIKNSISDIGKTRCTRLLSVVIDYLIILIHVARIGVNRILEIVLRFFLYFMHLRKCSELHVCVIHMCV